MKRSTIMTVVAVCAVLLVGILPASSYAATAREIDASVDAALDRFAKEVNGAKALLNAATGILIIPKVLQGGFIVGGEYGEGALRIGGEDRQLLQHRCRLFRLPDRSPAEGYHPDLHGRERPEEIPGE